MKLSLLSTLASGIFALAVGSATGITTHLIGEQVNASVAEAKTVEVLQATATRIAEQKERMTPVVIVTIPISNDQMNNAQGIPLHEQAPPDSGLGASFTYNTTVYPTLTATPHNDSSRTPAPVSAGIYAAAVDILGTPTAAATPQPTASAWPSGTPSATPVVLLVETLAATAAEWDATPTPYPTVTELPTITENPTPAPTVASISTSTPQPSDTATMEPSATEAATITPPPIVTVTDGPLDSPLPTPTPITTETAVP